MAKLTWIARRTMAVLRRDGALATVRTLIKHTRIQLGIPSPESREYRRYKEEADRAFDRAHGVDTGGTQHLAGLTIQSRNSALGVSHIATGPAHFHNAMRVLDLDPRGLTFVDLGSGKGRALMMAGEYPFAAITGIEFAEELHAICQDNLRRHGDPRMTCSLGDAEQFEFPLGGLVVFMNNPFDRPMVERIAQRLLASFREQPRSVRVVYLNPPAPDVFAGEPWIHVGSASGVEVFGLTG